jgi:Alpha/beta-hydrolase family
MRRRGQVKVQRYRAAANTPHRGRRSTRLRPKRRPFRVTLPGAPSSLVDVLPVDQDRARESGRELFDAVNDRWSGLPLDDRPRLVAVGEGLGPFGGETAFSGGVRPAQPDR